MRFPLINIRRVVAAWAMFAVMSVALAGDPEGDDERSWAFRPPRRPAIPAIRHRARLRTPVDAFILARIDAAGIVPAAEADRRTLLRRLSFDLLGLPPSPEQIDVFLTDTAPDAYERLVDRLLASPAHGERWGQHWLDVVRYADSDGFEYDDPRPNAWRYRDWVIDSLNDDKSFDRFVDEQFAADELFPGDRVALAALGLHRLGPLRLNAGMQDEAMNRQELLTEIVDVVGSAFLGLTLGCARCHDHKFDPLPQADYYRLQAFFAATVPQDIPLIPAAELQARLKLIAAWQKDRDRTRQAIDDLEQPVRKRLMAERRTRLPAESRAALAAPAGERTPRQQRLVAEATGLLAVTSRDVLDALSAAEQQKHKRLQSELERVLARQPAAVASIMAVADRGPEPPDTHLLVRGEPHQPGELVLPSFPIALVTPGSASLASVRRPPAAVKSTGLRTALAEWLTSTGNPLVARVFVNRLWQHHFGRGIVATPNDFGAMGAAASHPELLDWLAVEFIAGGWRIKPLHRLMVLSSTYRRASRVTNPAATRTDPDNLLLWRANRQRLEAETLRDNLLAVAGNLNPGGSGPGVRLPLPPEVAALQYKGTWQPDSDPGRHVRRSVFLFVKRNNRPPLFDAFDAPGTMASCGRRTQSSHAGQALTLLNSPLLDRQARAFARRLDVEAGRAPVAVAQHAWRLAFGRDPRPDELSLARSFLENAEAPWTETLADFCLVLFNLDEFLYVD